MQPVEAILFEPVGCLAEFPAEPFNEIAARLVGGNAGRKRKPSRSGSRSYWHLLNLFEVSGQELSDPAITSFELQAVDGAGVYEDVPPAVAELQAMRIRLILASSLSAPAVARFLEKCPHFSEVWNRDSAGGIKAAPLQRALSSASLRPEQTMFLTDTAEGLKVAKSVGIAPVLMMNDPDEARRLAMQEPAGGIVSLHELPDFLRLVAAHAKLRA